MQVFQKFDRATTFLKIPLLDRNTWWDWVINMKNFNDYTGELIEDFDVTPHVSDKVLL